MPRVAEVLPFVVDASVAFLAPSLASKVKSNPTPWLWGALMAWTAYGWLDHVFAAYGACVHAPFLAK